MEFLMKVEEKLRDLSALVGDKNYQEVIEASERGIFRVRSLREEYSSGSFLFFLWLLFVIAACYIRWII